MRARRRQLVSTLLVVAGMALAALAGPVVGPASAAEASCPPGTAWDNRLGRCV